MMGHACNNAITSVIYQEDPVPRKGIYGINAFEFRLASTGLDHFYDQIDVYSVVTQGAMRPDQVMYLPGRILQLTRTDGTLRWFQTYPEEYLELVVYRLNHMWKYHTQYLSALEAYAGSGTDTDMLNTTSEDLQESEMRLREELDCLVDTDAE